MIKKYFFQTFLAFICLQLMVLSESVIGQDVEPNVVNTETFLVLLESTMIDACDQPGSPFACYSKDIKRCREALEITTKKCLDKLRDSLPNEIDLDSNKQKIKSTLARCTMDNFIPAMGAENLNMSGCKK